jgi:hypothetical protein
MNNFSGAKIQWAKDLMGANPMRIESLIPLLS